MNFGPAHYVPVLKCKRGEKHALGNLAPAVRSALTPLMEVPELVTKNPGKKKTLPEHLTTTVKDLAKAVGSQQCFIDLRELAPLGAAAAASAFSAVANAGVIFVPVTGITRSADVAAALAHRSNGLGIRLTREEFEKQVLPTGLAQFLARHGIDPGEVDLLLDLGEIEAMVVPGALRLAQAFLRAIPTHTRWRTFTLLGSSFPKSMGIVPRHSQLLVDRIEWLTWRTLYQGRGGMTRLPTFGDCAIQHPSGVEGFVFGKMQVSATIRYTTSDQWLLIKGQSTKLVPAKTQFPALAAVLVSGGQAAHFRGNSHCAGCEEAAQCAAGRPSRGSPEVWRRIGTGHHLTTVTEQLGGLAWP